MKKIITVIGFVISSFCSIAQEVQLEETPHNWPVILSNLNQSQIAAGFLYNKSAMFANLFITNNFY